MAFGLTSAPGTFQGAMNVTLAPGLRQFVIVFFDDILVYSQSFEEHVQHLRLVFQWLRADQWKLKLSKCSFAQESISYLRHVILAEGLATDPSKIQAVVDWPTPTSVKELRGFLGLAGYYRKFVRNFGIVAKTLTGLLKKDQLFVWTPTHDKAFQLLKEALCSAPVLALPDFAKPFHINTDASGAGIGAVLHQDGHPLAFLSKPLCPHNQGLTVYEKEYLALLMAVDQWRHYLLHAEFVLHTDHQCLTHLNEQRLHTAWQQKVFARLQGLQYRIEYRKGTENGAADALSHRSHPEHLSAISSVQHQWLASVTQSYASDPKAQDLLVHLAVDPASVPPFTLSQGVIRYKNRIWLGSCPSAQQHVLQAFHASPVGGQSGFPVVTPWLLK